MHQTATAETKPARKAPPKAASPSRRPAARKQPAYKIQPIAEMCREMRIESERERIDREVAEHHDKVALLASDIENITGREGCCRDEDLINLRWSPLLLNELKDEALAIVRQRAL